MVVSHIEKLDLHYSKTIFAKDFGKPLNYLWYFCSLVFMEESAIITIFLMYLLTGRSLQVIAEYIITLFVNVVITLITKKTCARPRPTHGDFPKTSKTMYFRNRQSNCSLPSGDTLQAVNLAWFTFFYIGSWLGVPLALLAVLVAYSRVYLCCHWISDTVIGGLLGIGTTEALMLLGLRSVDFAKIVRFLV